MVIATQESDRTKRLEGENATRHCPSSDFAVMFVGFSSNSEDISDALSCYAVHGGQLLLAGIENEMFAALAEASFAEDWSSEADSAYDNL